MSCFQPGFIAGLNLDSRSNWVEYFYNKTRTQPFIFNLLIVERKKVFTEPGNFMKRKREHRSGKKLEVLGEKKKILHKKKCSLITKQYLTIF